MGKRDRRNSLKMKQRQRHAKKIARDKRKIVVGKAAAAAVKAPKKAPTKKEKPSPAPDPDAQS